MEIDAKHENKQVNIWLTRAESADTELRELLKPLYKTYKAKKYLVAVFVSGSGSLEDSVRDLLLFNKVRLRELEEARQLQKKRA